MLNKKDTLDAHIKRCSSIKKIPPGANFYNKSFKLKASHDLSQLNRQVMTYLYSSGVVDKCKIQGLGVAFKPKGENRWYKICNPFGSDIYEMVRPLPPLHEIVPEELAGESDLFRLAMQVEKDSKTNLSEFFSELKLDLQLLQAAVLPSKISTVTSTEPESEQQKPSDNTAPPSLNNPAAFPALTSQQKPKKAPKAGGNSADTNIDGVLDQLQRDQPTRGAKNKPKSINLKS